MSALTERLLKLADSIDHINHYRNMEGSDVCKDCADLLGPPGRFWPCVYHEHAEAIRREVAA